MGNTGTHLHHDKEVKDQDERSEEGPGNLITGQKSTVQFVPADPVGCDDKYHHGGQVEEEISTLKAKEKSRGGVLRHSWVGQNSHPGPG